MIEEEERFSSLLFSIFSFSFCYCYLTLPTLSTLSVLFTL